MSDDLMPCRECGAIGRAELFPATNYRTDTTLYLCPNGEKYGGTCPSQKAYLFADAWNRANTPSPPNALLPTEEMIWAGIEAAQSMEAAMRFREDSERPEDLPDYDEGDVVKAVYTAMRALAPKIDEGVVRDALERGLEYAIDAANEINDADSRIFQQIMRDVAKIDDAIAALVSKDGE